MSTKASAIDAADIVEANGKTIRQNNMEKTHKIPVGTLVEVKYDTWHSGGACEKVHARLWVVSHDRDCDGTPLYTLSPHQKPIFEGADIVVPHEGKRMVLNKQVSQSILNEVVSGMAEEQLTPVELTHGMMGGDHALQWEKNG